MASRPWNSLFLTWKSDSPCKTVGVNHWKCKKSCKNRPKHCFSIKKTNFWKIEKLKDLKVFDLRCGFPITNYIGFRRPPQKKSCSKNMFSNFFGSIFLFFGLWTLESRFFAPTSRNLRKKSALEPDFQVRNRFSSLKNLQINF